MTSLVATDSVTVFDEVNSAITLKSDINIFRNRERRRNWKSKENTYKHKCNQVLKRKLKKYKLRQDGKEDQDVLDVSNILVSSLIIKSSNNLKDSSAQESEPGDFEVLKPKNYLFKMVRRKEACKISDSLNNSNTKIHHDTIIDIPLDVINQDKKQTNAFKLLMDSRNKSIGTNSPGKEKSDDQSDVEEAVERKNIKAKRNLVLQKMAEAKGSIRNKEIDNYQDEIIKQKMEKRAVKLKSMIFKDTKSIKENEDSNETISKMSSEPKLASKGKIINNNNVNKQTKTLKIVDIFNTIEHSINISPQKKNIPKEDQEFMKKLSPSLKKKESMLCYFKKLEKDLECSDSENDNLIKVKLKLRNKKRNKKKKLSLKKSTPDPCDLIEIIDEHSQTNEENEQNNVQNQESVLFGSLVLNDHVVVRDEVKSERQKRKRNSKIDTKVNDSDDKNSILNSESRPKRSVKRPVKYVDDACLSSSDEELHIFTPKKKKHADDNEKKSVNSKSHQTVDEPVKLKYEKKISKDTEAKKPSKLAPIFISKNLHLQINPAALEAKQKFLQSGVPDKLKKIISRQISHTPLDNSFPVVVHVQQGDEQQTHNNQKLVISLIDINEEICSTSYEDGAFKKLLNLVSESAHNLDIISKKQSTQTMLQNIKQLHPKFPVYRTYRYLRGKGKGEFKDCSYVDIDNSIEIMNGVVDVINDSPDRLNWTDKYKPMSTKQIIGNFESIKELRKWLVSWTENELKMKRKMNSESDSSDYYQSDTDSRDSIKSMNNLLVLTGPTGCGKTASVYAVAAELAMKVIEVNASSKRTGKIMLQDLQEATQSHKVNRGTGSAENSQKSQDKNQSDMKKFKKRGRPKKSIGNEKIKKHSGKSEVLSGMSLSQECTRTDSSLILIDDADIVFDQDDGFSSAIVQLVQSSKRPVILITSSLVCPHLQRFLHYGKILKICPLSPRMLGTWLDIMCLADSGMCWPGVGAKFLNYFKGDIRKTINYLQFYVPSYVHGVATEEETASQQTDFYKTHVDEENSCSSWADNDDSEGRLNVPAIKNHMDTQTHYIWMNLIEKELNISKCMNPVQLFDIWWSMPHLFTASPNILIHKEKVNSVSQTRNDLTELDAMANAIDAFSLSDYISHINPDTDTNITSQPWRYPEEHSVSERENFEYYIKEHTVTNEICHTLVTSSIAAAQDVLSCDRKTDIHFPGMNLYRDRDKIVSRHKSLASYLPPSAVLDRRALALDYWPSCRTICRFEKSKNDTQFKRNNRFCHYLKSISILCKSDTFDNLCDSLCASEGTESNIINFNN